MKTISAEQRQLLEDLAAEGLLRGLPIAAAEKDIHVTDLLHRLTLLEVRHAHFAGLSQGEVAVDDGIRLIFAGGTCLSKAYGLIPRMSEDVDIKVALSAPSRPLKRGCADRARLKALHDQVALSMLDEGFALPGRLGGRPNPQVSNKHRYFLAGLEFAGSASSVMSLRPELKLEMIHREPVLGTDPTEVGYLYETLARRPRTKTFTLDSIRVAETLAEKVLSLLRRTAFRSGPENVDRTDDVLVRHVYDVHQILVQQPSAMEDAPPAFASALRSDREEYEGQYPPFDADPAGTLRRTLQQLRRDEALRRSYEDRLLPLVYTDGSASIDEALDSFEIAAMICLDALQC